MALGFLCFVAVGVDVKQNREPRRTSPFPFVAGREARYERDAQAHIRSHSNARPTSLPVSDGHSPLSHHARWRKTKSAPCHKPRSEARRGRRRRDTSKPTTHTSGSHRRSSRRIRHQTAPRSDFGKSRPERATAVPASFHTHAGRFTVHGSNEILSSIAKVSQCFVRFCCVISDAALRPGYVRLSRSL